MLFVLKFSFFKFTVLLFGLYNAPSTFYRLINHVFSDIMDQYILVYLYNILVYSETADHEKHLCGVFLWLCAHKF